MKETTKASIGGFAFNLDTDAYQILENYLTSLRNYFKNKSEGEEIIADIEYRMSELLQMRMKDTSAIITAKDAEQIIDTMGNPKDFEDSETKPEDIEDQPISTSKTVSKKLYRDVDHKIIAGVCSGLGHYFRFDPVLIRIGFILFLFASNFFSNKLNLLAILAYLVLWAVMPKAKTMAQKLAMMGQDPSIERIENREDNLKNKVRGEALTTSILTIIRVSFAVAFCFIGILLFIVAITAGYSTIDPALFNIGIKDLLVFFGYHSTDAYLSVALFVIIPSLMLIYTGIRLFKKFQKRDITIICVAFVVWFSSAIYIGRSIKDEALLYKEESISFDKIAVNTKSDTLYIDLAPEYTEAMPLAEKLGWYRVNDSNGRESFFAPRVLIIKDSAQTDYDIIVEKKAFHKNLKLAQLKAENSRLIYFAQDSLIALQPTIYSAEKPWDRELFRLVVKVAPNKVVIVKSPLRSFFTGDDAFLIYKEFTFKTDLGN